MTEDRPRSADIKLNTVQKGEEVRSLRERIVGTFKEQMKLRRKLMEIDSHLLGLSMDAERQHLIISHWESRNNKLYKSADHLSRARTQQSLRRREMMNSSSSEHEITEEISDMDGDVDGELSVQHAWAELADIEREQERWAELRAHVEEKLEICRKRGVELEDVSIAINSKRFCYESRL